MAFKAGLVTERRRATLTQEELTKEVGVGIATIAWIETGEIEEPRV